MKKKLFLNLVFTFVGTFIIIFIGSIVTFNFIKDSRVFAASPQLAAKPQAKTTTANAKTYTDNGKDQQYERTFDTGVNSTTDNGKLPTTTETVDTKKQDKIKVDIINYTGISNLAEEIRAQLEALGYDVSAGNGTSYQAVETVIIEKSIKANGSEIQDIIKAGRVVKFLDASSRFDIVIKIGDDYKTTEVDAG